MSSPLADSPYALAREMERRSRTEQPCHDAASDHYSVALQHPPRRTLEAQADIAAARAAPTAMEVAMQEIDRAAEQALDEHRNVPTSYRSHEELTPAEVVGLETALSNAALADTPAVREMGGGFVRVTDMPARKCRLCGAPYGTDDPHHCIGADAVVLIGTHADRYRAIAAAARKAQASAAAARADGAALLQLFQAFCSGLAPGKEG